MANIIVPNGLMQKDAGWDAFYTDQELNDRIKEVESPEEQDKEITEETPEELPQEPAPEQDVAPPEGTPDDGDNGERFSDGERYRDGFKLSNGARFRRDRVVERRMKAGEVVRE